MKKVLHLFLLVCFAAGTTNAQIKKGSIFLGGDISGSTQKIKSGGETTYTQSGFNVSPAIGRAIKDNLVLGVNANFGIYNSKSNPDLAKDDSKSYGAGVFVRKYKNIANSDFYMFIQGALGVSYYTYKREGTILTPDDIKRTNIGLSAYPGLSYAVNKSLNLETGFNNLLMLNYQFEKRKTGVPTTEYKANSFNISSSLNNVNGLYIGFRLLIGK